MSAFSPLFVPAELQAAVSGRAWLAAMLDAERALAQAGALAGLIPAADASAIAEECRPDRYEWDVLLEQGRAVGNPVEPLVTALVARVGERSSRYVHLGATSQDVMDTAAMLVAARALPLVLGDLRRVAASCAALARAHRDTPIVGRTLLQQAAPTTFGLKAAGWLVAVLDVRSRLAELQASHLAAQLGGAVGTLAAFGPKGPEVARLYARELGLREPELPWHTNRVVVAELGASLATTAGVLAKVGLDVLLLAQTEVGEVREGGEGGGSSAMPHKRNPVGAMSARACSELARAHASVLLGSLQHEHERAAGPWQAEWEALGGALAATGGAAAAIARSLASLEVDETRMLVNLQATGGLVASERVALVLAEKLGRSRARALVREAVVAAAGGDRTFAAELAARETGLEAAELDRLLDPSTSLGSAGVLVDRAVARFDAEHAGW